MTLLVIWLFVETQRSIERERQARLDGKVTYNLWRERRTYAIISTIFGLSYIGRGFYNVYNSGGDGFGGSVFAAQMVEFTIYLFEGASMGVLMVFHCINFSNGRLFTRRKLESHRMPRLCPESTIALTLKKLMRKAYLIEANLRSKSWSERELIRLALMTITKTKLLIDLV